MWHERVAAWQWLLLGSAFLALPTAVAPGGPVAGPAYLCGSIALTVILFVATSRMPRRERTPWLLLSVVTLMWLVGDSLQRVLELVGHESSGVGLPDMIWLSSYLVEILAINALIKPSGCRPRWPGTFVWTC